MSSKASIVVGLGYGDEGKGLATDYLCSLSQRPLVIRFNGGQQAGHTVCKRDGRRHVFSSFGAGTLAGAATYWSAYCTFSVSAMLNEYRALVKKTNNPLLYLDGQCAVTTHYDVLYNRLQEQARGNGKHGSCGMGFGNTLQRQSEQVSLKVTDLVTPGICSTKMAQIRAYYQERARRELNIDFTAFDHDAEDNRFREYLVEFHQLLNRVIFLDSEQSIFNIDRWTGFVFEGAQGILLDMDFGVFPHVTRSNTTSKNALEMIRRNPGSFSEVEIYYVSRAYHTRHGEGPFPQQDHPLALINNLKETNVFNDHQGNFKTGPIDKDQVKYAIQADSSVSGGITKNLVLTCLDQVDGDRLPYIINGQLRFTTAQNLPGILEHSFGKVLMSASPYSEYIDRYTRQVHQEIP